MEYVPISLKGIKNGYFATIHGPIIRVWNARGAKKDNPKEIFGYLVKPGNIRHFKFPRSNPNYPAQIRISDRKLMIHCLENLKAKSDALNQANAIAKQMVESRPSILDGPMFQTGFSPFGKQQVQEEKVDDKVDVIRVLEIQGNSVKLHDPAFYDIFRAKYYVSTLKSETPSGLKEKKTYMIVDVLAVGEEEEIRTTSLKWTE